MLHKIEIAVLIVISIIISISFIYGFLDYHLRNHRFSLHKNNKKKQNKKSIKFVLWKDDIKIGEYTHVFHKEEVDLAEVEKFARENICDFFNKIEIIS